MIISGISIYPFPAGTVGYYLYFFSGFVLLWLSGDYLVRSGVSLGKSFRLSPIVIGITVISMGTSAPELLVSLKAAVSGHPDISVGNVVGSNITNIGLVLGITSILIPLTVRKHTVKIDGPIMVAATLLFILFARTGKTISRGEGLLMLFLISIYILWLVRKSRKEMFASRLLAEKGEFSWWGALLLVMGTSVGLVLGADWIVVGASGFAHNLGISERVISLSMVALGTSLPELTASVAAALKKQSDISIGNIIGSNLFNLFGILGLTALVHPFKVNPEILHFDVWVMLFISVLLLLLVMKIFGMRLTRWKGIILLSLYCGYLFWIYNSMNSVIK